MKTPIFLTLCFTLSFGLCFGIRIAQANPVVLKPTPLVLVSDIDDTIKVSHILDKDQSAANSMLTENVFRGMADLFQILKGHYPQMAVVYLSNAQVDLMQASHQKFISDNGFPSGALMLRRNPSDPDHKINRIREIIKMTQPRVLILLGDNGGADIKVYDQVKKEFPQIVMLDYIRELYFTKGTEHPGQELLGGQMGFVTPVEVAIDLAAKRLVSIERTQALIDLLVPEILRVASMEDEQGKRGELSFPRWQDCRDFKWPPGIDAMFPDVQRDSLLKALKTRILSRCSKPGLEH